MPRHLLYRKGLFIPEAYRHRIYRLIKLIPFGSPDLFYIILSNSKGNRPCGSAFIRFQHSRGFCAGGIRIYSVLRPCQAVAPIVFYKLRGRRSLFQHQFPGL